MGNGKKIFRFKRPNYNILNDKLFETDLSLSYKPTPIASQGAFNRFGSVDLNIPGDEDDESIWQNNDVLTRNFQTDLEAQCIKIAVTRTEEEREIFKGFIFDKKLVYDIREKLQAYPEYVDKNKSIEPKKLMKIQ